MQKNRKRVPEGLAADVMFAVDLRCCLCEAANGLPPRSRNGQIHHLDGDPSNNAPSNLVWLCLEHHEDVSKTGAASRRISADVVRRYHEMLQVRVGRERSHKVPRRADRAVYQAALDANVVTQFWKLRAVEWDEWRELLREIVSYPPDIGHEAKRTILERLSFATLLTRRNMPFDIATSISDQTIGLLPLQALQQRKGRISKDDRELLGIATEIGEGLAYDGAWHLHNMGVLYAGCEVLWRVLSCARVHALADVESVVTGAFETAMMGATQSGLEHAPQLVEIAKKHGMEKKRQSPDYPRGIIDAVLAQS